jgi:hypothetical protein
MTVTDRISNLSPRRREKLVRAITTRAAPTLATWAARSSPLATLAGWLRPALAAASLVGVLAAALLATARSPVQGAPAVSEALGYPDPLVAWLETGHRPSVEELVVILEERDR